MANCVIRNRQSKKDGYNGQMCDQNRQSKKDG